MGVVFCNSSSGAGISLDRLNVRKDISAQIDEGSGKVTFDVGESFRNLRVLCNGRDQTTAISNYDYINFRFTLEFIPHSSPGKKELLIYFDKP